MIHFRKYLCICFLSLFFYIGQAQETYFPPLFGQTWETTAPSELNWCQPSIDSLCDFLEFNQTKSFIILKDGKIALEKYFGTYTADSFYVWNSAAKSLKAALIGIAQEEGFLDIEDPTAEYLGAGWTNLPQDEEESITLWHQLTMTCGFSELNFDCYDPECLVKIAEPGERWAYHNAPYSLLTEVLEAATGQTINDFTTQKIKSKIGMWSSFWYELGYYDLFVSTARDMARFGLLIQNDGVWNGESVIADQAYLEAMISPSQELNPSYGYLWWLNGQESFIPPTSPWSFDGFMSPDAPADIYSAAGKNGQYISIWPSQNMVVVRQGLADDGLVEVDLINAMWAKIVELDCNSGHSELDNPSWSIFPNPTAQVLNFSETLPSSAVITILDFSGKTVLTSPASPSLQIGHLSDGMYFVEVKSGLTRHTQKFLKRSNAK